MTLVNKNHGIIRWVSGDKTRIKIRIPRGGLIEACNEGFEIGDRVCFIVGPSGQIIKVMPKYAADLIVEIANDPLLQAALQNKEVPNEHNPGADEIEEDCPDRRPSATECTNLYGQNDRGRIEDRASHHSNKILYHNTIWPFDRSFG